MSGACSADQTGWLVTVAGHGYVQVTTGCTCGDPEHDWHAGQYKDQWFEGYRPPTTLAVCPDGLPL